jgi:hypothetical protein
VIVVDGLAIKKSVRKSESGMEMGSDEEGVMGGGLRTWKAWEFGSLIHQGIE